MKPWFGTELRFSRRLYVTAEMMKEVRHLPGVGSTNMKVFKSILVSPDASDDGVRAVQVDIRLILG